MDTRTISAESDASRADAGLWTALYAMTQHWKHDAEFYEDELSFLRMLVDKHLTLLIDPKNIERTRPMVSHLIELEHERVILSERIVAHALGIAACVKNPSQDSDERREIHAKLEDDVARFTKKMRAVKGEVFKLTESVIHSEKVKKLLDWG